MRDALKRYALDFNRCSPSITGEIGELEAAIMLGMTVQSFAASNPHRATQKGYDLLHDGVRVQVKTVRHSLTNAAGIPQHTTGLKQYDWDVLLALRFSSDFELRDVYRLTRDEAYANRAYKDGRIRFSKIDAFRMQGYGSPWV